MPELLTIKGSESTNDVQGYALPKNMVDFELPITLLLADNYSPTLYTDRSLTGTVDKKYKSLNVVDRDIKEGLLFNEDGYVFKWNADPKKSLIAPKMLEKSVIKEQPKAVKPTLESKKDLTTLDKNIQIGYAIGASALLFYLYKNYWKASNLWKVGIAIGGYMVYKEAYKAYLLFKENKK